MLLRPQRTVSWIMGQNAETDQVFAPEAQAPRTI